MINKVGKGISLRDSGYNNFRKTTKIKFLQNINCTETLEELNRTTQNS